MTTWRNLSLDRMLIEEAGPDPQDLALALLAQLPALTGPIPVREIAAALDIVQIREAPTKSLEAALVTDAGRSDGAILINSESPHRRQRFSIAHELGHYLNLAHRSAGIGGGFACTAQDLAQMSVPGGRTASRHARQEAEANRFAIELLAPRYMVRPFLKGDPDLAIISEMTDELDISREACARRYVELSPYSVAVVFSKDSIVRYSQRGPHFPFAVPRRGRRVELGMRGVTTTGLTKRAVVDPCAWIGRSRVGRLTAQTLWQQGGYAMTLLEIEP